MPDLLAASRASFITEVRGGCPAALRGVDFTSILDALVNWSRSPDRGLQVRRPGKQRTVSFAATDSGDVLWAAYPNRKEGAKVVVLPQRFRRLPVQSVSSLLRTLDELAPGATITTTGYLQLPLHLLTSDRALNGFLHLLGRAQALNVQARVAKQPG